MKKLAGLAALALAALPFAAYAQSEPPARDRDSVISVSGTGTVSRPPDKASFNVSIETVEDSAAASTSKNNAVYNELKARLGGAGIGEASIKTLSFNVQYNPRPPKTVPGDTARYGYITNRFLEVDSSVDGVGKAIDLAIGAGATNISSVTFGLRDRKGAYNQALAAAVADARSQADALAAAAGLKIVRVRTISTGGSYAPRPMAFAAARVQADAGTPTEIDPAGPVDVTATVNVGYAVR